MLNEDKTKHYLKLFLTGIILIWLYMRSPFNPLYSDSTPGEWAFVKLNFIYWLLVSVFLIWIIYFVNKKNFEKKVLSLIIGVYGTFMSYFVFYGFDVMDSGFALSKQWAMYNGSWTKNFDFFVGASLLGGLWLNIINTPSLLWARLGFIVVQIITIILSYKLLLLYFKNREIFLPFLSTVLFLYIWHLYFTINYDNLSNLFLLTSIYLVLKDIRTCDFKKRRLVISGLFVVLAAFAKITYLPCFVIPVILIIFDGEVNGKNYFKKRLEYFFLGSLICVGILAVFMYITGGVNNYTGNLFYIINELFTKKESGVIYSHDHSFSSLYGIYMFYAKEIFSRLFNFLVLVGILEFIRAKVYSIKPLYVMVIIFGSSAFYLMVFDNILDDLFFTRVIAFSLAQFLVFSIREKSTITPFMILAFAGCGMFFFGFVGSDIGFRAAFHSTSGLIVFALPIILIRKQNSLFLYYFLVIAFIIVSFSKKNNLYREPNISHLSATFQTPALYGIKSSPERVDVVDDLLSYLKTIPNLKEKKIMFTHHNPMMYYLLEINYPFESPWDILNDYEYIKKSFYAARPDLFIIPLLSHRIREWPFEGLGDVYESKVVSYYKTYDKFIEENNYKIIYKNFFYTVWAREDYEADKIVE